MNPIRRRESSALGAATRSASLALFVCAAACGGARDRDTDPSSFPEARVELELEHQQIAGFGASSAWTLPNLTDALADQFFSPENGIGLSLLRLRITPSGTTSELETAKKASLRGARVWAAPWSPPGAWKTNGTDNNGGKLRPERYADWAARLTGFAKSASEQGISLVALSAQNEPNWKAEWETCEWSPEELRTFVRDHLGPALSAEGLEIPILAPETNDWHSVSRYADALLEDPLARSFVGPVATHSYGGRAFAYSAPKAHGKELWQTEFSDPSATDPGMDSALRVARLIHEQLTVAQVSAWHYWWLVPRDPEQPSGNSALTETGVLTRRAYALGNWSRFVRPGFVRVQVQATPQPSVSLTAFRSPLGSEIVIVGVNDSPIDRTQTFSLGGVAPRRVIPWVTSEAFALTPQEPISVEENRFSATLAARSLTSFVSEATPE